MKLYKGILIVSFLTLASLSGLFTTVRGTSSLSLTGDPLYYLYSNSTTINIDGTVTPGEYPDGFPVYSVDGINFANLSWAHSNGMLYVGIVAAVEGWVGFGQGSNGMLDAPMVFGSVTSGNVLTIKDAFGPKLSNTFPSVDSALNPTGDINQSAGTEVNGVTTIEFSFPLNSTDSKDAAWAVNGTYSFFLAADKVKEVNEMDYHTYHSPRNLKVQILPESIPSPTAVELSATTMVGTDLINISSTAMVNSAVAAGIDVTFAVNTSFGLRELGSAITGTDGVATLTNVDLGTLVGATIQLVAIHKPSIANSYSMSSMSTIAVSGENIQQFYNDRILNPPEYDQFVFNPNMFNNSGRLAGVIMLFLLLFVVFMLTWEYVKAVVNWVRIAQLGKGIEREEDEI